MLLPKLHEGTLLRRYKRFLAEVELRSGRRVTAHCPNPGRMTSCMEEGGRVWLSHQPAPHRKLKWTWELSEVGGERVMVNTARANPLAEEALRQGLWPQSLSLTELRSEQRFGESRLDFKLLSAEEELWVEVKSATLRSGPSAVAFPDAPSVRARRHLKTLVEIVQAGHRAALLFVLAREGAERVSPAAEVDPLYAEALREAAEAGVELAALCVSFTDRELLPVRLGRVCLYRA